MIEAGPAGQAEALLLAFAGGLALNFMPCVLPVLSIKALSLCKGGASSDDLRRDGLLYGAGVLSGFLFLAGVMLAMRDSLDAIGWGFQLQNPAFVLFLAMVLAWSGSSLLADFSVLGGLEGVFAGGNRGGAFASGAFAVLIASSCTAPFMAAALGYAMLQPVLPALGVFTALGAGFAAPYILIAFVPAARALLPKPGPWMASFKQLLSFPLFASVIWLLWVLGKQTGADGMALGLMALFSGAATLWCLRTSPSGERPGWRLGTGAACLCIMVGCFVLTGRLSPASSAREASSPAFAETAYSPDTLEAALSEKAPVFLYFTADWCITCKANERSAIKTPETAAFFRARGIKVIVGDWTRQDPYITAMLAAYGRAGVPMYLYYPPGAKVDQGILLPQILTPALLREKLS